VARIVYITRLDSSFLTIPVKHLHAGIQGRGEGEDREGEEEAETELEKLCPILGLPADPTDYYESLRFSRKAVSIASFREVSRIW